MDDIPGGEPGLVGALRLRRPPRQKPSEPPGVYQVPGGWVGERGALTLTLAGYSPGLRNELNLRVLWWEIAPNRSDLK